MKIHYISDLHIEYNEKMISHKMKQLSSDHGNICIIAGDMIEIGILNRIRTDKRSSRLRGFVNNVLRNEFFKRFDYILYVLGNHEFYGINEKMISEIISFYYEENIYQNHRWLGNFIILNNSSVEIEGINFIGSTLWTDFNKNDPIDKLVAQNGMNDYVYIKNENLLKITPDDIFLKFKESIDFIDRSIAKSNTKNNVVITHHCPSYKCLNPAFKHDRMNSSYASDLDGFILHHTNKIPFWIHGHNHYNTDFMIGNTRILSNQLGYIDREHELYENFDVNRHFIIGD